MAAPERKPDHAPGHPQHAAGRARSLSEIAQPPPTVADRLTADEIRAVLAHYELGAVRSAQQMVGGAADAPKALITTTRGRFVLKRRAPGNDEPFAVALAHSAMLHLGDAGLPVARLIATAGDHNSMVQLGRHVYEMLGYIEGSPFDGSVRQADLAGEMLGRAHAALRDFHPDITPQHGSYHAADLVVSRLERIARLGPAFEAPASELERARSQAEASVDGLGFEALARQLTHGDWHPGNLLFRDGAIVGVLDFDAPRLAPRVTDTANGALQFSLAGRKSEGGLWRLGVDASRREAFLAAYQRASTPLTADELAMVPALMAEALIAELSGPIAATGRFGDAPGPAFLGSVGQVVAHLLAEARATHPTEGEA